MTGADVRVGVTRTYAASSGPTIIIVSYKRRNFVSRDWRKQSDSGARRVRGTDHVVVCGVAGPARLFGPRHHCQGDRQPGGTATSVPTVIVEAISATR